MKHTIRKNSQKRRRKESTSYHPSKKTDISMCLILSPFRRIDLHHIKLALFSVPMENTLHTRPSTPLQTPPARLGAAHANLRYTRDVYVRSIDARIPPSRAPSLLHIDDNRAARSPARAPIRCSTCPPLTFHTRTLALPRFRHLLIIHLLESGMLLPPGGLAPR